MRPPPLKEMTTPDALRAAWARVQRGGGAAGSDGLTVADFARVSHEKLPRLCRALQESAYQPQPLRYASLQKPAGASRRELAYPPVRDRIAQTAIYRRLGLWLDRSFLDVSYGYRPGRSRHDAVQAVLRARSRVFRFVLDADIEAFFDAISHALLPRRLRERGIERARVRLLRGWVKAPLCKNGRLVRHRRTGLPHGAVASPLLANSYPPPFGCRVREAGAGTLVRYAGDFVVLCRLRQAVRRAKRLAGETLAGLGLRLHAEKTRVASFEEGFFFLGHHFRAERPAVPRKQAGQRGYGRPAERRAARRPRKRAQKLASDAKARSERSAAMIPAAAAPRGAVSLSAPHNPKEETRRAGSASGGGRPPARRTAGNGGPPPPDVSGDGTAAPLPLAAPAKKRPSPTFPAPPSPEPDAPPAGRSAATPRALYLQRQGATLRLRRGRLVLAAPGAEYGDDPVLDVPARKVSHVIVFGACRLTLATKRYCLREGVPVTFLARSGAYYGRLDSGPPAGTALLHRQLERTCEPDTRLRVARMLVDAKLANSHALLRRYTGDAAVEEARRRLRRARRQLPQAGTLDAVRGHEGDGAAALFGVFGRLVKVPGFAFERRTRRPPTDPVNSLLSLGYTLLYHHARAFLRVCGLHAHAGFLHEARPDHPALASDLVEPFRVLVERLALRLLNRRVLNPSDFRRPEDGGACLLTAGARKRFFQAFEKLLSQEAPSPEEGRAVTYRRRLHDAAQNVAQFVQGEAEIEPFRLR